MLPVPANQTRRGRIAQAIAVVARLGSKLPISALRSDLLAALAGYSSSLVIDACISKSRF